MAETHADPAAMTDVKALEMIFRCADVLQAESEAVRHDGFEGPAKWLKNLSARLQAAGEHLQKSTSMAVRP